MTNFESVKYIVERVVYYTKCYLNDMEDLVEFWKTSFQNIHFSKWKTIFKDMCFYKMGRAKISLL